MHVPTHTPSFPALVAKLVKAFPHSFNDTDANADMPRAMLDWKGVAVCSGRDSCIHVASNAGSGLLLDLVVLKMTRQLALCCTHGEISACCLRQFNEQDGSLPQGIIHIEISGLSTNALHGWGTLVFEVKGPISEWVRDDINDFCPMKSFSITYLKSETNALL